MIKVQDAFSTPPPKKKKKKVKGSQMTLGRPTPSLTLALYLTVLSALSFVGWNNYH